MLFSPNRLLQRSIFAFAVAKSFAASASHAAVVRELDVGDSSATGIEDFCASF